MPRQSDHPDIMAEIFAAELRADAEAAGQLQNFRLEIAVAIGLAVFVAGCRQGVQIAAARELDGLQIHLGRGAADHDREVIGRTGGGAERADLLVDEFGQRFRVQHRFCLLVQKALVGRAAALGDEQEFVLVARLGIEVDLRRQIVAGIDLLVHRQRRHLAVAQIGLGIGPPDALGQRRGIVAAGPDLLALLAHHDRGAGILAHRQDLAGRDIRVFQQVERDEAVIRRSLRIIENGAQLRQMAGAQQMLAIDIGFARQQRQRLGRDLDDPFRRTRQASRNRRSVCDTARRRGPSGKVRGNRNCSCGTPTDEDAENLPLMIPAGRRRPARLATDRLSDTGRPRRAARRREN